MAFIPENFINKTLKSIKPSGIRRFFDIAETMDDVISLGIGEPDFHSPEPILEAGIESLRQKYTKYTSNYGFIELRQAICAYLQRRFGLDYHPENEILVTVGASEAVDIALRSICNPGDEILICEPYYVAYGPMIEMAGGVPRILPTHMEDGFRLTPESLEACITPKTKAMLINFPCNPTGASMNKAELTAICEVILRHDILVIADEIYAELTYDYKPVSIAAIPGMRDRVILISGVSKAFAMTGWRIGYIAAPEVFMRAAAKIHQYSIMSAPTVSQKAAIAAFNCCDADIDRMVTEYDRRRKIIVSRFNEMGLETVMPQGAFYVFPCIKSTGLSSDDFCNKLIYEKRVAVVPGTAFGDGGEGFVRCSYAYSVEHINIACDRIAEFLASNRK